MVVLKYFTKYVEAEALATIIAIRIIKFVYDTIFCGYKVPTKIVSDNRKQFNNEKFLKFCHNHKVQRGFSIVARPQANVQVEVVNNTLKLKLNLKMRLEVYKGAYLEKLPKVIWAYRIATRTPNGETPLSLAFHHEAMVSVEIEMGSLKREELQR